MSSMREGFGQRRPTETDYSGCLPFQQDCQPVFRFSSMVLPTVRPASVASQTARTSYRLQENHHRLCQ